MAGRKGLTPFDQLSRNQQLRRLRRGDLEPTERRGTHGHHRTQQAAHGHPWGTGLGRRRSPLAAEAAMAGRRT